MTTINTSLCNLHVVVCIPNKASRPNHFSLSVFNVYKFDIFLSSLVSRVKVTTDPKLWILMPEWVITFTAISAKTRKWWVKRILTTTAKAIAETRSRSINEIPSIQLSGKNDLESPAFRYIFAHVKLSWIIILGNYVTCTIFFAMKWGGFKFADMPGVIKMENICDN